MLFLMGMLIGLPGCVAQPSREMPLNLTHLNALYREVSLGGRPAAVVYVYSEYPDYRPVEAPGEGIACVDDAARAAGLFLHLYQHSGNPAHLEKARRLLNFLLYMQAENGLFYNFVHGDWRINREGKTSRAELGWWTARALEAIGRAVPVFQAADSAYAHSLLSAARRVLPHLDTLLVHYGRVDTVAGLPVPGWLLYGSGADATATLLLGLVALAPWWKKLPIESLIARLAEGILLMQIADTTAPFSGAFRSWKNEWHGWGNSQSRALLAASALLHRPSWRQAAALEVDRFYPRWIAGGFPAQIRFSRQAGHWQVQVQPFPQIAYAIRPALAAAVRLYRQEPDPGRLKTIRDLFCWFLGDNPAGAVMWDSERGLAFDGIESEQRINRNAGAESTIEALLSRLAVRPVADVHPEVLRCGKLLQEKPAQP